MNQPRWFHAVAGFALFSMFFGAGNLIFPLSVALKGGQNIFEASLGFLLSSVFIPALGVLALLKRGSKENFFSMLGPFWGSLLAWLIVLVWIPWGSGPRCITVSHGALSNFIPIPLEYYSLIYTIFVAYFTAKRSQVLDILGQFLTPILLLSLGIIGFMAFITPGDYKDIVLEPNSGAFFMGLSEGYNTMDLMAAIFFSSSVMGMIQAQRGEKEISRQVIKDMLWAGALGLLLLTFVYLLLIYGAYKHQGALLGTESQHLFPVLVHYLLGEKFAGIMALTVILACFTTSVALTAVVADQCVFGWRGKSWLSYTQGVLLASVIYGGMSLMGHAVVSRLIAGSMQVVYPFLMIMTLIALFTKRTSP